MSRPIRLGTSGAVMLMCLFLDAFAWAVAQEHHLTGPFPPYPDVWGIELPFPRPNDRNAIGGIFYGDDGDITILRFRRREESCRVDGTCCDFSFEYGRVDLFKRSLSDMTVKEMIAFSERHQHRRASLLGQRIVMNNGRTVEAAMRGHNCFSYGTNRIVLRASDGSLLRDVHLYYMRDEAIRFSQRPDCEPAGGASFVRMRVQEIAPILVPLDGETFLVHDFQGNTIIRFDSDLMTKFPLNDRVFVVERKDFDALYERATHEKVLNQAVHDSLLRLLLYGKTRTKGVDQ